MPSVTLRRAIAGVAAAATLAACGPGASPAATSGAVSSGAPATQAPAASDPFGLPSFALPSFTRDADLEAMLPDELAGQAVQKTSMTGDSFLGAGGTGSVELDEVLRQAGKTPADLSVAFAGTDAVTIVAYRIRGVPATTIFASFLAAAEMDSEVTVSDANVGGKAVKKVVSSDTEIGTVYVYTQGDVMFLVGGDAVPAALLGEAFSKLP